MQAQIVDLLLPIEMDQSTLGKRRLGRSPTAEDEKTTDVIRVRGNSASGKRVSLNEHHPISTRHCQSFRFRVDGEAPSVRQKSGRRNWVLVDYHKQRPEQHTVLQ